MRDKKISFTQISFYDRTGIKSYLEKQAEKGWFLEKVSDFAWHFRRIPPKKIHYAVAYYPKASEFDSEVSENQRTFWEYCEHTGWKLAASKAQMQIFYNEQEDVVPIETEAEVEVEQIHKAAKKGFMPPYGIICVGMIVQLITWLWSLSVNPIECLSKTSYLLTGFCWVVLLFMASAKMIKYFTWYKRAKRAAQLDGTFLETKTQHNFLYVEFGLWGMGLVFWITSFGGLRMSIVGIFCVLAIVVLALLVLSILNRMKKRKHSAKQNFRATIALTLMLSVGLGVIISGLMLELRWTEKIPAKTYEFRGEIRNLYGDELPLKIEDITTINSEDYSYEVRCDNKSFLLEYFVAFQNPRMDKLELPSLHYSVIEVKWPLLYEWCKNIKLDDAYLAEEDTVYEQYRACDATSWEAKEAYQFYSGEEGEMRFLLCYDNHIVEIDLGTDEEFTPEQKMMIKEKLVDGRD